jgi:hypothetical protein
MKEPFEHGWKLCAGAEGKKPKMGGPDPLARENRAGRISRAKAPSRQGESLSEAGFGSGFPWRLGGLARVFFRVISRAFSENNFHARFSSELHFDTDPSLGLKRARLCATLGA